ncbi:DUF2637 domain-containing protein [Actinomadura montaniterrae]|uniref:DUF2637 domain-containing protein n=1 Tax=Actinomadura montaniterrae TaxID=1803903 RepID=A0A6L3VUH9_9ACTN|nr:DUF2637 domain-containing protein [Actinomadura montaniterrae]KAB2376969.1 DUF2637 domain-containing protein [Actinomadura montaniterrae]
MSIKSLWRRAGGGGADLGQVEPRTINGGEVAPGTPWGSEPGVREIRQYAYTGRSRAGREGGGRDLLSGSLLSAAGLVIAAALVGAGYVAYESQRLFSVAHNGGDQARAAITAALPDAGWVAMALVALVAALRGRSSARARIGVVIFFALSLGAQVMYAERTPEGVLVAVIAPIALAWMLESFVVEVRRWASTRRGLDLDESPILSGLLTSVVRLPLVTAQIIARLLLWVLRLGFDRSGTWAGVRDWILDEAPLAPGRTAASLRAQAAIEQAGGVEQAAERVRVAALAEAQQIKDAARAEAEHTRQQAAEEIAAARAEAERQIAAVRASADAQVSGAAQRTDQEISAVREETAEQLDRMRREMAAALERAREQHRAELAQREAEWQGWTSQAQSEREQAAEQARALANELAELRAEHALLLEVTSSKARLIAAYERLRSAGDLRYGDRERVAEVARELYQGAGLASEGTARNYLYEYVSGIARDEAMA